MNNSAGKGDKPRSCFSKKFKDNYDSINWNGRNESVSNKSKKKITRRK